MIEVGLIGLAIFALFVVAGSVSAVRLAHQLPWATDTHSSVPLSFGLALAPFLLGIATILVLTFAGGQPPILQAGLAFVLILLSLLLPLRKPAPSAIAERLTLADWALGGALLLIVAALLFVTVFVPLTQNDALEYASAARAVYENNWIGSYPVLDPLANSDGFYGPWTHPPLYVALIFLMDVLQGGAEAPGLMRLIAPWFAITGSMAVFALARPLGRTTALAASVIFLSTPLLFLGAASSLLDALPISAFALLLLVVVQTRGGLMARSMAVGLVLGLSLWTHSLAILYIPLTLVGIVLLHGLGNPRRWLGEAALVLVIALLAGGVHYVRNTFLFGAPISDNPVVFALPRLAWDEYFIINRGLDTTVATIQYGILKGWFAFEAFGLSFWGLAVGVFAAAWGMRKTPFSSLGTGTLAIKPANALLFILLGLLATYFAGVIASVLIGVDLMVKNERYLLSIQSVVAVLGGFGYMAIVNAIARLLGGKVLTTLAALVLGLALALQSGIFVQYSLSKNDLAPGAIGRDFDATLAGVPDYQVIGYLRDHTPQDAVVLSLKPSDMYYSDRRQIGYLDPRLVPFYEADTVAEGVALLSLLGVSFIHVPSYGLPPLYNSVLIDLLRDPQATTLRFSNSGGQIYELVPSTATEAREVDVTPGVMDWSRETLFELGGRKRLSSIGSADLHLWDSQTSEAVSPLGLFQRSLLTLVRTGGPDLVGGAIEAQDVAEIGIDLDLAGHGLMTLIAVEYDADGARTSTPLGTFELSKTYPELHYARRFLTAPGTRTISVVLQQQGQSTLTIERASVVTYALAGARP